MADRLRTFLNRPLRDGDRARLFVIAVAVIAAAAVLFALLDHTDRTPPPNRSVGAPAPAETSAAAEVGLVPVSTPGAPSEESDPPASLRPTSTNVARSKRAARRFLADYLLFAYGRAPASAIRAASAELRAALEHQQPRVPPAERRRRARVELLQTNGVSRERADLLALIDDGARRYSVRLQLANTPTGWLVTGLER